MPVDGTFDWAIAGRPLAGEVRSGDAGVVVDSGDRTVLTVIDGLGHGPEAADAAERARHMIEENAAEPLEPLIVLCHQALAGTRGAALGMAIVHDGGAMDWLAIGNVEAAVVRTPHRQQRIDTVFHFAGVLGHQLPTLHVPTTRLEPGDVLLMATDGIASAFLDDFSAKAAPQRLADRILERHARPFDDALVLAARYRGR